jgi:hypothetical protein
LGGPERDWVKGSHRTRVSMCEVPNCRCVGVWRRGGWLAGWVGAADSGLGMPRSYRGLARLWLLLDAGLGMPRSYRGLGLLWLFRGLN